MRVHRHGVFAERGVEHHIGGLAAHAGQRFEFLARARHFAAMLLEQDAAGGDGVLGLGAEQADGLDVVGQPSSPSASIAAGVPCSGKNLRVAMLTDLSVAWADSSTAISSWNGVSYSSSVVGFGLAACRRAKISAFGGVHGRGALRRAGAGQRGFDGGAFAVFVLFGRRGIARRGASGISAAIRRALSAARRARRA